MSFTVRLGADVVPVEPGATVPVTVEIANRSDEVDQYEIGVQGVDEDWVAIPVPVVSVDAREIHVEKFFFKPPRTSESLAQDYPFVVSVRSLTTGETRTAQAVLSIKPFHHLSMEISPKKAVLGPIRSDAVYRVTILNLGNTEHTLNMVGTDPEDALTYEFDQVSVTVGPGQTKVVDVRPVPVAKRPFSSPRLHGFSVTARSTQVPSVIASAQAQAEQRPLLAPGAIFVMVLALGIFAAWLALLPKPPQMLSLNVEPAQVERGQLVTVEWQASSNSQGVRILLGERVLFEGSELNGRTTFTAEQSGTIDAVAYREGRLSEVVRRAFEVREPPVVPDPEILSFDVTPKTVNAGETLLVQYKLGPSVTRATLAPTNIALNPRLEQVTIRAEAPGGVPGEIVFQLVAENSQGKVATRSVRVQVNVSSEASIVVFRADPASLSGPGDVTVTWQLSNAARTELTIGTVSEVLAASEGVKTVFLDQTSDLRITGYDAQGRTISRTIRVVVKEPELPPLEPEPNRPTVPPGSGGNP
ncbi:MAG: hypothetical protein SNJ74_07925 [Fimbriimonadaceae bacterium]